MKWNDFLIEKEKYKQIWTKLKNEYSGEMRKFLDKSYMVIFYHPGQIFLDAEPLSIAKENSGFFASDKRSQSFLKMVEEYKREERAINSDIKDALLKKIAAYDISQLSVIEHRFEIRFPTVDIDLIQQLKQSKYCDQKLTDMSKVSIRVVLKGR